jgi:hypothetical protein
VARLAWLQPWPGPAGFGGNAARSLTEEESARYRQLVDTFGNLVLLESDLNIGASNKSFAEKHNYYSKIAVKAAKSGSVTGIGRMFSFRVVAPPDHRHKGVDAVCRPNVNHDTPVCGPPDSQRGFRCPGNRQ